MSPDPAHVLDMINAAETALRFMDGRDDEDFLHDDLLQSAVLYQFTVFGEASRRVSQAYRDAHPGIPWTSIAGFRNRIVHEYDDLDLDVVLTIIRNELATAIEGLRSLLPAQPTDGEDTNT